MYIILDEIKSALETAMSATAIKKYYTGKVHNPPLNYFPVLMVYGNTTTLLEKSTARDRYRHEVVIELMTNVFAKVSSSGVEDDKVLDAQKQIMDLMEEVDASYTPKAATILGTLRRNITGTDYLFNDDIVIQYEQENVEGTVYYRGILTFTVDKFRNRS